MDDVLRAGPEIVKALGETLTMLLITIPLAVVLGTLLGTVLFLTRPGSLVRAPRLYVGLNGSVNILRSFPFLILLVAMIPITSISAAVLPGGPPKRSKPAPTGATSLASISTRGRSPMTATSGPVSMRLANRL